MSAIKKWSLISVDEYLAGELVSPVKHDYVAGVVYAMAGGVVRHSRIATNITGLLVSQLRGKRCQPFNSDMKIRIRFPTHVRFYYPDVSVVCHSNPPMESFQDQPAAIFEVLSESTRRVDEGEKKDAYLTIPTLQIYALVEQESATVILHRRTDHGFVREVMEGLDSVLILPDVGADLPLREIYEGVKFEPDGE